MSVKTKKEMHGYKLTYRPDLPDQRDYLYSEEFAFPPPSLLPPKIDLRPAMPAVFDQGQLGSCVANATAANYAYLELLDFRSPGQQPHEFDPTQYVNPSRLFIYYNARAVEGWQSYDQGCYIRDAVATLAKQGVCREPLWPYDPSQVFTAPNANAVTEGSKFKISAYYRINSLTEMKQCLACYFPFVFGMTVYESMYNIGKDGMMPMPQPNEQVIGGHAVTAVGYDDSMQRLIVRNSWGNYWGDNGHFYVPYNYMVPTYTSDYWTLRS